MRLLHLLDLLQPTHVAFPAVEFRTQEGANQLCCEGSADHLGADAEHVHVVVLHALVGRVRVVADRCADPCELAGRDRRLPSGSPRRAREPCPGSRCAARGRTRRGRRSRGRRPRSPPARSRAASRRDGRTRPQPASSRYVTGMEGAELWRELGQQLRVDSVRAAAGTKSGHPTSSMSAADLMSVLLAEHLRYDFDDPDDPRNDHLVFSKGHASPLLYSMYKAAGAISDEDLLSFRRFGSKFEGHPTPIIPWVDVATGSLGQGLPYGVGIALAGKRLDKIPYRVWVLCGDSEMAEGSMWEAFEHAWHEKLDNLIAIIDVNRLGQRGEAIDRAYTEAVGVTGQPTVIVAKTIKGKGVKAVEDKEGFHGKALDDPEEAIQELGGIRNIEIAVAKPEGEKPDVPPSGGGAVELPAYEVGG